MPENHDEILTFLGDLGDLGEPEGPAAGLEDEDEQEKPPEDEESLFSRDPLGRLIRADAPTMADLNKKVKLRIDGSAPFEVPKAVPALDAQGNTRYHPDGTVVVRTTTIYDASKLLAPPPNGASRIPILCHQDHLTPVAVCRACTVQIVSVDPRDPTKKKEQRKLLPACQHRVEEGMEVHTMWSPDPKYRKAVRTSVQVLFELLAGDHRHPERDANLGGREGKYHNELDDFGHALQCNWQTFSRDVTGATSHQHLQRVGKKGETRFPQKMPRQELVVGLMHDTGMTAEVGDLLTAPPFVVDHNNCILCDRCARACSEVKPFKVIGRSGKGSTTKIAFDLRDLPMAESSCRSCGECMTACPTGAITFQYRVSDVSTLKRAELHAEAGSVVSSDELEKHPLFGGMSKAFLEWNRGAVRRREVKPGEVLAEEGEYGTTAFLLEDGYLAVCRKGASPPPSLPHGDVPGVVAGLKKVPKSAGTALWVQKPDALDLVGEMSPMSHARRNASLVALTPGRVLEIGRNVLFVMTRDPKNRERFDRRYAGRALFEFLPKLAAGPGLFGALDKDEIRALIDAVTPSIQLVRANPGYLVCREGEVADAFYLIRLGFVGVSKSDGTAYRPLKQGDCFGEVALLQRHLSSGDTMAPSAGGRGIRTATCTALDRAELVIVPADAFDKFLESPAGSAALPKLRQRAAQLFGGPQR